MWCCNGGVLRVSLFPCETNLLMYHRQMRYTSIIGEMALRWAMLTRFLTALVLGRRSQLNNLWPIMGQEHRWTLRARS